MKFKFSLFVCVLLSTVFSAIAETPKEATEPVLTIEKPSEMMRRWLLAEALKIQKKWESDFDALQTPEQVRVYSQARREFFWKAIGGQPEGGKTPLNVQLRGTIERPGYTIEKILLETQPGFFVSGLVYLPDREKFTFPRPGILFPLGHTDNGKAGEKYQRMAASLALHGFVVWTFDPIEQGERAQIREADGKSRFHFRNGGCANAHNLFGVTCGLLGRNVAYYEVWDLVRGIDYLQSRPEIDPQKIGVCGTSGGGTQTAYIMCLDDRVTASAPSCYICSLYALIQGMGPHDAEQNLFGFSAFPMDHADFFVMRAPKPTLLCATLEDYFPFPSAKASFTRAKRIWEIFGAGELVGFSQAPGPHSYALENREATVQFFLKRLCGQDVEVHEPQEIQLLTELETWVTKTGWVKDEPGAKTGYDLNRAYARRLAERRRANPLKPEDVPRIRELVGIQPFEEIPAAKIVSRSELLPLEPGVQFEKIVFESEPGILLPALRFIPASDSGAEKPPRPTVLFISSQGKVDAYESSIRPLVQAGKCVISPDLRGWGETRGMSNWYYDPSYLGADGKDFYTAFVLGKNYVGMRTNDLLSVVKALQKSGETGAMELVGHFNGTIPVLHAAACEPKLFSSVTLQNPVVTSWTERVEHGESSTLTRTSTVFGALTLYDLPELKEFWEKNH